MTELEWDDPRVDDIILAIKCTYCQDYGYVWVSESNEGEEDTGQDWQMNCPYCNPKIDLYAADRSPEF